MSKGKKDFTPIEEGKVKLYLCGPTVYGLLHIGNFRGPIFFNLVRNWLEKSGYDVTFVYNYTDVDDKIIQKAIAENVESTVISERYIEEFQKDFNRLGLRSHTHNPKVTDFIPQIIKFVEDLVNNETAYVVDGEVFYAIEKFSNYGCLSGKKLDDNEAGSRVEVDERKRNPADFVLWKPSKEGEPSWDSPWGPGRPGWHIECSAMIQEILGDSIDIHGGGIDLIFPHHENEIAQGEGRTNKTYCHHWMHNNFINMKDQKMSKSLGNIIPAREFMDKYHPEVLKYVVLSSHYRSVLNVNEEKIVGTMTSLGRVYTSLLIANEVLGEENVDGVKGFKELDEAMKAADKKIVAALDDDFNTGEALAAIFEVVREFNALNPAKKKKNPQMKSACSSFINWVKDNGSLMALFQEKPETFLLDIDNILLNEREIDRAKIDELMEQRNQARHDKNWELSDQLRDQLADMGIEIQDGNTSRPWKVKY
jgi:cysteinyl-tRNA synthetase